MRILNAITFAFVFLKEVIWSNLEVAHDVLTPKHLMTPELLEIDAEGLTDHQLLAYANLISMTPGTLSLEVSEDRRTLLIHAMYVDASPEQLARKLESTFKKRIAGVF